MSVLEALAILIGGVWAGTINTVVGSGTLITFPLLLALGYSPLVANMSNNVGLVPGSVSGTFGYRHELAGQGGRLRRLGVGSTCGAAIGATLLLTLPAGAFSDIVPGFIALALVLVVVQPRLSRAVSGRRSPLAHGGPLVLGAVLVLGIYGGYFGAAQGILLMAVFGLALDETLQRTNALKNALTGLVNGVSSVAFIIFGHVNWTVVALLGTGSILGGLLGSRIGRRLPDRALRGVILVVGCFAILKLVLG